jgi:hypothetical protein
MSLNLLVFGVPLPTLHPDTLAYKVSIDAVGGTISNNDLLEIDKFVKFIYNNNLRDLFRAFYPYAGNDWLAARQALWVPVGGFRELLTVGTGTFVSSD